MLEKAPKMKNKGPSPDVFDHSRLNKLLLTQSSPTDSDLRAWPWAPCWNASKALESLRSGKSVNLSHPCRGLELLQEQISMKLFWLSCSQSQLDPVRTLMYTKITVRREWPAQEAHVLLCLCRAAPFVPRSSGQSMGSLQHCPPPSGSCRLLIPRGGVGVMSAPPSPLPKEPQTHKSLPHPNTEMVSHTPEVSLSKNQCCVCECSKKRLKSLMCKASAVQAELRLSDVPDTQRC